MLVSKPNPNLACEIDQKRKKENNFFFPLQCTIAEPLRKLENIFSLFFLLGYTAGKMGEERKALKEKFSRFTQMNCRKISHKPQQKILLYEAKINPRFCPTLAAETLEECVMGWWPNISSYNVGFGQSTSPCLSSFQFLLEQGCNFLFS